MTRQLSLFDEPKPAKRKPKKPATPKLENNPRIAGKQVDKDDVQRLQGQVKDIYQALLDGPKLNIDLLTLPSEDGHRRFIQCVTARITNLRAKLKPSDQMVFSVKLSDGLWMYRLGKRRGDETTWDYQLREQDGAVRWLCPCCDREQSSTIETKECVARQPLCQSCRVKFNV